MKTTLTFCLFVVFSLLPRSSFGESAVGKPIGHFRFNGNYRNEGTAHVLTLLTNTPIKNDSLYLNGQYFNSSTNKEKPFCAIFRTPSMNYEAFTVAMRVRFEDVDKRERNLITGGTSCRWFGMHVKPGGQLIVTFNNQDFKHLVDEPKIENLRWAVIACSVDMQKKSVVVYINGTRAASIDLPEDLKLRVVGSTVERSDKCWTFTNYSNAKTLKGMVDELIFFDRALSPEQLAKIPLKR